MSDAPKILPLTPAVFHVLLALSQRQQHGYAIMKQAEIDSAGSLRMSPGTLYGTLGRMVDADLVEEVEESSNVDRGRDDRRRYYRITGAGQRALGSELGRLRLLLSAARKKGIAIPVTTSLT